MSYINVGAQIDNTWVPTKKALKIAMKEAPETVRFYPTALFGPQRAFQGNDLPEGDTLTVVGPNPFDKRSWYANVTSDGKVT